MKIVVLLVLLASALAGCLGSDDDPEVDDENGSQGGGAGDNGGGDGPDGDGEENGEDEQQELGAPEGLLEADLLEGEAPLNVSFALDATHDDPANLTWTLDTGDESDPVEGQELPLTHNHTYQEEGNYTVVFNVTHGEAFDTVALNITVEAAEEHVEGVVQENEGSWPTGVQGCAGEFASTGVDNNAPGILQDAVGGTFLLTFDSMVAPIDYGIDFLDSSDATIESFASGDPEIEGTVPEGTANAIIWSCLGADVSYEFVVEV